MTTLDHIENALHLERYCCVLCALGYAEEAAQGHATGYRITPRGYQAAMAKWGAMNNARF